MFLTSIEDFDHKPYVKEGEIQRGQVVLQGSILWGPADNYENINVPTGFVSNLASLPWFTSLLFKILGKHQRAAILHDWLYRNGVKNKTWCDEQFDLAMEQDGVKRWRRAVIIAGLRIGGHKAWMFPAEVVIV